MITADDLQRDFGLRVSEFVPHAGGFESDCWVADGTWFVKVWKQPGEPRGLELLQQLKDGGLPVIVPVPTVGGQRYAVLHRRPYAVFLILLGLRLAVMRTGE